MTQDLDEVLKRLDRLEAAVFATKRATSEKSRKKENFKGPSGGVKLLLTKDFFSKKRRTSEVRQELERHGYHYTLAAVQTALNRASIKSGPLTSLKEAGKKLYVVRR